MATRANVPEQVRGLFFASFNGFIADIVIMNRFEFHWVIVDIAVLNSLNRFDFLSGLCSICNDLRLKSLLFIFHRPRFKIWVWFDSF